MPSHTDLLPEIRELFARAAVAKNAGPMAKYMKNMAPFLGIKAPERRVLQREIFRHYQIHLFSELELLLRQLIHFPEREFQYLAMEWLYHRRKDFQVDTIVLLEEMLTTRSWWDTVDFLSARCLGVWAEKFPEAAGPVLNRYISSTAFWLNRAAILHQLHYKTATNTNLLEAAIVPHLRSKEFFIRKAIGWALRQYARTNPDWVRDFVASHPEMSRLSMRETRIIVSG